MGHLLISSKALLCPLQTLYIPHMFMRPLWLPTEVLRPSCLILPTGVILLPTGVTFPQLTPPQVESTWPQVPAPTVNDKGNSEGYVCHVAMQP
jgi:hypothetical protein